MSAPSRRDLLASAAALAFPIAAEAQGTTVTVTPSNHPDTALIAACGEFDRLERLYCASFRGELDDTPEMAAADDARERYADEQDKWLAIIVASRPATFDGHVARARSLILWEADAPSGDVDSHYANKRLLGALLRDLVAQAGSAAA